MTMGPTNEQTEQRHLEILGHAPRVAPLDREPVLAQALASWTELRSNYAGERLPAG